MDAVPPSIQTRIRTSSLSRAVIPTAACGLFFSIACFSAPSLNYELHPVGAGKSKTAAGWKCRQYDDYLMMRCSVKTRGLEIDAILQRPAEMRRIVKELLPGRNVRQRIPEFMPVRIHIRNWRKRVLHANLYRFRLRDMKSGRTLQSMTPTPYYREFYTDGLGILDFYWAFEQKDGYHFLQPLPRRLLERQPDTPSPAERDYRRKLRLREILRGHSKRNLVAPVGSLKGYLLFARPTPGRRYVLEYGPAVGPDASADTSPKTGTVALKFPPLTFRVQLTRSGELAPSSSEKLEDKRVRRQDRMDSREQRRENRELFIMHRQLREHDRIRKNKNGSPRKK